MSSKDGSGKKKSKPAGAMPDRISSRADRRVRARKAGDRSVWFGVGMFGVVGWTVAVTTLIGIAVGVWMDRAWPGGYSWTLTMLLIGLIGGCMNAWYWVQRESRAADDYDDDDDEPVGSGGRPGSGDRNRNHEQR